MRSLREFTRGHPRLMAFLGLAGAMVGVLLVASKDVALDPGQRATLILSTVVAAAFCVWIVSWE